MGISQTCSKSIIGLNGNPKRLVIGIDKLWETRQRDNSTAELSPLTGRTIAFLAPMYIERTDKSRALATIVVNAQKLETSIVFSTQVTFNLVLIG